MTLVDVQKNALRLAEEAAGQLSPVDALGQLFVARGALHSMLNQVEASDGARAQIMHEFCQRFAAKSGMLTFWSMRVQR